HGAAVLAGAVFRAFLDLSLRTAHRPLRGGEADHRTLGIFWRRRRGAGGPREEEKEEARREEDAAQGELRWQHGCDLLKSDGCGAAVRRSGSSPRSISSGWPTALWWTRSGGLNAAGNRPWKARTESRFRWPPGRPAPNGCALRARRAREFRIVWLPSCGPAGS